MNLVRLVNLLKSGKQANIIWSSYQNKELAGFLYFYTNEMRWIKYGKDVLEQYNSLLTLVHRVSDGKEKIMDALINSEKGLLDFLYVHSMFHIDDNDYTDWFVSYMLNKLDYDFVGAEKAPDGLVTKFGVFDPEHVAFERGELNISYGMWKRNESGRVKDPIHISYMEERPANVDIVSILSSYEDIRLGDYDPHMDDDLPF